MLLSCAKISIGMTKPKHLLKPLLLPPLFDFNGNPLRKCLKYAKYAFKYAPSMDFQVWFVSNADFKMQTWFECILKFAYLKKCILDFAYLESSMLKSAFETNHTWKCILDFFHTWFCILGSILGIKYAQVCIWDKSYLKIHTWFCILGNLNWP